MGTYVTRWRPVELALLAALALALVSGAASLGRQDALQEKMIRLHVIANSDSASDQAMKLRARDAVLSRAEDILRQAADRPDAQARLRTALPELEQAAFDACGGSYPVRAELTMTEFPLKEYDGFALPAGEYLALRVIIGEGAGRNWW
ncbi:MAG TPA: stage II sporulation protein R, partial [Oscillibacter sp.]|nr:stage II sporulation protein R [Oscillibacter sp.]